MENEIKIGKKIFIRNAGKDEYWLQNIIYDNPKVLPLPGNLIPVSKEEKQSKGGRLDILLKERDENIMYEIEVMLGETDPSHIIRSIEYWDYEKRKYPQRQHFCVLVAESFDRRYFNVIQLMSLNIPMIAIQADLIEINGDKILNFSKIIDIYVEPAETEEEAKIVNEATWNQDAQWVNDCANEIFSLLKNSHKKVEIKYTQSYINITIDGKGAYWFHKRIKPTAALVFVIKDAEKAEEIERILKNAEISYSYNNYKEFLINVDCEFLKKNANMLLNIHSLRYNKVVTEEDE